MVDAEWSGAESGEEEEGGEGEGVTAWREELSGVIMVAVGAATFGMEMGGEGDADVLISFNA